MSTNTETVISFTTIPSRLSHIQSCIESLKQQGFPVYLWIPKYFKRGRVKFDGNVPSFCDGIHVDIVDDEGPITKLLPALRAGFKRIITADDDVLYPGNWAANLVFFSDVAPENVYCYRGRVIHPGKAYKYSTLYEVGDDIKEVNFVTGTWGAIYSNSFFDESIYNERKKYPLGDDIVISCHLKKKNIKIKVIPGERCINHASGKIDPLWVRDKGKRDTVLGNSFWAGLE